MWSSTSGRLWRWMVPGSRSRRGWCLACWARTGRARPRWCAFWPRCWRRMRAGRRSSATTWRENLEMFGRLFKLSGEQAHRRAGELLERFDLAQAADRPARTYSGGMRRRLDIASSLLTRPQVLFLDEPTTGLDPRSRNEIWAIVRELRREGTTLLLTTQYLEEADQLADRIAVIDRGKVIAEGTGNELKDRVGGQILEIELASAGQRDRAQALLAGVGCGEPAPDERPDRLTLPAPRNGLLLVEGAAAELRRAQIGVSDIGLRRPTLDDVFLQLTGAPPSEDGGGPTPGPQPPEPDVPAPRTPVLRLRLPSPQAVRSAVTDTAVVTGRNLRHFIRQPDLLVFSTIQPVLFVLLFVYVFDSTGEFVNWLIPVSPAAEVFGHDVSSWPLTVPTGGSVADVDAAPALARTRRRCGSG